jgi:plasmid stability protein
VAALTIRNLPDETHRALKIRAAVHGRSTEAEVRGILEAAVRPDTEAKLGSLLLAIGRDMQLTDEEVATMQSVRMKSPVVPIEFE